LTGVVSWGEKECGRPNKPGVYANVVWYKDWIEKRTAGVSREIRHLYDPSKGNIATGFTSVLFVLIFIGFLRYLIQ
jgi:secreted trypsin-like serine protease